jgi:hypothetical protein
MADKPKISLLVKTPRVPNYIFLDGLHEGAKVGIEHLSEAQLRAVGEAFTDELIAQAKRRRVVPATPDPTVR